MKISFKPAMQKVQKLANAGVRKIDHGLERTSDAAEYIIGENPVKSFAALVSLFGLSIFLGNTFLNQQKAFEDAKFDADKFSCQNGKELELKKFSLPKLFQGVYYKKLTEQSFLCDDGRTIVYNLPEGTKTTEIPMELIGEKIKGVKSLKVTENLDSLAKAVTEKAFKTMILKK